MMKKAGFPAHVAGGIEPAASIGGMFMPPIMGAGGFIMAELTGVPYSHIMLVAVFPAVMYFFSVFLLVHYEAKKNNIQGERSEFSAWTILKKEWFYTIPLVVITVFMLYGFSPGYAAILGLLSCIVISWVKKETRIGPKRFVEAAREGTESSLKIGATVGIIGIIIGVLTFSGLVLTFADIMIELAGGSLLLTILLVGPGLPGPGHGRAGHGGLPDHGSGRGAGLDAPGRQRDRRAHDRLLAVPGLEHHAAGVYRAYTGATIAKANMWKTAFTSFKFAKYLYLGPILFGYVPGFSLNGDKADIIKAYVLIVIGTWLYSWAPQRDLDRPVEESVQPVSPVGRERTPGRRGAGVVVDRRS